MTSIEFGKKCQPYNIQYKDIFGYVPCRDDYLCDQNEYFNALLKSINEKQPIETYLTKKNKNYKKGVYF